LLSLHIYFSQGSKKMTSQHYHDDGDGFGDFRIDTFVLHCDAKHLSLDWLKEGPYLLPEKIQLVIHGGMPETTQIDGREIRWNQPHHEIPPFSKLKTILQ